MNLVGGILIAYGLTEDQPLAILLGALFVFKGRAFAPAGTIDQAGAAQAPLRTGGKQAYSLIQGPTGDGFRLSADQTNTFGGGL